jgi:copper resistance protein B
MKARLAGVALAAVACAGNHGLAAAQDHAQHQESPAPVDHEHETPAPGNLQPEVQPPETQPPAMDHAAMGHAMPQPPGAPREPVPVLTAADRAAATPAVSGHAAHDSRLVTFIQLDRLEGWNADEGTGLLWDGQGWIGGDLDKAWLRTEGERVDDSTEAADVELLYGRAVARWWDVVAGVRHDLAPGRSQSWVAIGIVGLAPQKFDVEATAYFRESGRAAAQLEVEYDVLLTNRLILQPQLELNVSSKDDVERGVGSGVTTVEAGLRLRYEITRQFAPYLGVTWERAYDDTADFRRAAGEDVDDTRVVAGLRIWF